MSEFFKKNKTVLIIILTVVILGAAGIVYAVHNKNVKEPNESDSASESVSETTPTTDTASDPQPGGDITAEPDNTRAPGGDNTSGGNSGDGKNTDSAGNNTSGSQETPGDPNHQHEYKMDQIVTPTCTRQGYTIYRCSCGATENRDFKDKLSHKYGEWTVKKAATSDAEGEKYRSCIYCGNTETAVIPKGEKTDNSVIEITGSDQYGDYKRIELRLNVDGMDRAYVIRDYRPLGSELSYELTDDGFMIYFTSLDGSIKKDFLLQFPEGKDYRLAMFTILPDGMSRYKYFYSDTE